MDNLKLNNDIRVGMLIAFILTLIISIPSVSVAQSTDNSSDESNNKKKTYKPGYAWSLVTPLGIHEPSTIDTLLYNYQHQFVPSMTSDAYATTGQLTGPALNMIYFDRKPEQSFLFNNAIEHWIPTFDKFKFYNVYIPMTLLSYNFSTGRESHSDLLRGQFAGNVNRKIGVGAFIDYPYTKGCYLEQAAKGLNYGASFYYNGDRYKAQAFYYNYMHLNKENGGITNDLYITNPAEVQGGVTEIEPKSIPVNLSDVHNRIRGQQFYMSHSYSLGFSRDITQPGDSINKIEFVPVTNFIYSFDYSSNYRKFLSTKAEKQHEFWENTYFNPKETDQVNNHWQISNSFGIEMIEGFQKWAPFGLAAWVTYSYDKYWTNMTLPEESDNESTDAGNHNLTPLPENMDTDPRTSRNRLWISGRISKMKGRTINYFAEGKFGLIGSAAGEIEARGNITTRFRLGHDTVMLSANGEFKNLTPDWTLQHYAGNHFIWNNDFGKIRSFRVGGKLHIPWTKTDLGVNFENVQNYIYFNASSLPEQYGGSIQIFSAYIDQKLKFGIWNWNNRITYQLSSNKDILPLPVLSIYSNMFLNFKVVKVLTVQLGVDCDYYTAYPGMMYQPATMTFHVQGENPIYVGNYANCNVYLTCKLSKVRFFVMCSHVNQDWFGRNYFSMPHYPINPRQLRLGLSVDFAN